MITFNYETPFVLEVEATYEKWVENVILNHGFTVGEINYIFCDDVYLHKLNVEFLQHDTLTDVISFDNTIGKIINGIFIFPLKELPRMPKIIRCLFWKNCTEL